MAVLRSGQREHRNAGALSKDHSQHRHQTTTLSAHLGEMLYNFEG